MNVLEELYYGNITPFERDVHWTGKYKDLLLYISRHEKELTDSISDEHKIVFEKYRDCTKEVQMKTELEAFVLGFKLGGQIMLSVLSGANSE